MALRFLRTARKAVLGPRRASRAGPGRRERASWRRPRSTEPPPCPPGWHTAPPDFIGVGSQKCGTSWWFSLLNAHPEVQAQARKEVRTLLAFRKPMEPADVAEYVRWFPRPPGKRTGEWTPSYMTVAWLGRAIEEAAPEARLLALVRDPVERYRSGLPQWRKYHTGENDDDELEEQQAVRQALRRGFYGAQLTQLADAVGRERILVLQYERCAREPRVEFARTLAFLGLPSWEPPDELLARRPAASSAREPLSDEEREDLIRRYAPDVRILRSFAPDLDLSLWPNFAYALPSP
ncbi:MAG: sulfotransferase, partial [Chloroflexi bacterium]|nr:sulfotransferase [Chloroflexota bacterium]